MPSCKILNYATRFLLWRKPKIINLYEGKSHFSSPSQMFESIIDECFVLGDGKHHAVAPVFTGITVHFIAAGKKRETNYRIPIQLFQGTPSVT